MSRRPASDSDRLTLRLTSPPPFPLLPFRDVAAQLSDRGSVSGGKAAYDGTDSLAGH